MLPGPGGSPGLSHVITLLVAAAAVIWAAALPAAAYALALPDAGSAVHAFAVAVYGFGSAICHQRDERSFHLFAERLPVCARCTGLYLGSALVAIPYLFSALRIRDSASAVDPARARRLLGVAALPMAISIVYEWTTGRLPSNGLRAATGIILGGMVARLILEGLASSHRPRQK